MSKLLGLIVVTAIGVIVGGATVDTWWTWFIAGDGAPFAGSLPDITFTQGLGLSLFVTYMTYRPSMADIEAEKAADPVEGFGARYGLLGLFWIMALFYHFILS